MFEKGFLERIIRIVISFAYNREEATEGWKILHNSDLTVYNFRSILG
jgi:hypothetical protein